MKELEPRRRRVVVIAGSVAAMSAAAPNLMRHNPILGYGWIALMIAALVYLGIEFGRMKGGRDA